MVALIRNNPNPTVTCRQREAQFRAQLMGAITRMQTHLQVRRNPNTQLMGDITRMQTHLQACRTGSCLVTV